ARRHAAEATRAANAAEALARESATAAFEARDAANDAAQHAENAAKAADEAAKHAGDSAKAAKESTAHAAAAKKAATAATNAVAQARKIYDLARRSEQEDLETRTAAAVERARDLKAADDERRETAAAATAEAAKLTAEADRLAAEAAKPGTDLAEVAAKGRQVAVATMKHSGPWGTAAAQAALAGPDSAVVDYVRTGRDDAVEQDELVRVERLADQAESSDVRAAAVQTLGGEAAKVRAFLAAGQHEAAAHDYRVRVVQISDDAGKGLNAAAQEALNDGSTDKLREFITTVQYTARTEDERVAAARLLSTGGPEVKAAARIALEGPPQLLHHFIEVGQYKAKRKDQLAATHQAAVQQLIAQAAASAATAQQRAAEAARVAALARKAAAEAADWAKKAKASSDQAKKYADDARKSADAAQKSANEAAASAKAARAAEADAKAAAREATVSAARAADSAAAARYSADDAWAAANAARASAIAAGKDAAAADKASKEAYAAFVVKRKAEEAAKRREEAARKEQRRIDELKENAAIIEAANAEADETDVWGILSETGHFLLDVGGLVPGFGEIADGANCAWYGAEGDAVDAGLSCASAVPIAGYGASAVKFGKWGGKATDFFRGLFGKSSPPPCKVPNSFTPETPVAKADGTTAPISGIRIGDRVLATDPGSGRTAARPVEDVIVGYGTKTLVRLTVDTDGDRGDATGTVTATDGHPFWAQDQKAWVDAGHLRPGAELRTPDGTTVEVVNTRTWTQVQKVYNLSVKGLHTYYALAGDAPLLVHNCGNLNKDYNIAGGHAKDHVGLSDDDIITRAPTLKGGKASSLDPSTAQQSIDAVLDGVDLNKWAARNPRGTERILKKTFKDPIGRVADSSGNVKDARTLELLIRRVDKGENGHKGTWIVYTLMAS
ncbi:polymorphic toxin-type HINT domain-containing protein, partial [Streptomyces sp. TRM49041]|uniref:polymorphic toxin-type HINT domain-containing protein n=1 Tax=Streptomyces sp. TRM49041 TaxID=2603216 RepID=UPI0021CC68A1